MPHLLTKAGGKWARCRCTVPLWKIETLRHSLAHRTARSCWWLQFSWLWKGTVSQLSKLCSDPLQLFTFRATLLWPKVVNWLTEGNIPKSSYPSCRHATSPIFLVQVWTQTVAQVTPTAALFSVSTRCISTIPSFSVKPFTKRILFCFPIEAIGKKQKWNNKSYILYKITTVHFTFEWIERHTYVHRAGERHWCKELLLLHPNNMLIST